MAYATNVKGVNTCALGIAYRDTHKHSGKVNVVRANGISTLYVQLIGCEATEFTILKRSRLANKFAARSDLVSIRAEKGAHTYYSDNLKGVKADFCAACEEELLIAIGPFYGYDATVAQLRRPEPKPKKVKDGRADTTVKA